MFLKSPKMTQKWWLLVFCETVMWILLLICHYCNIKCPLQQLPVIITKPLQRSLLSNVLLRKASAGFRLEGHKSARGLIFYKSDLACIKSHLNFLLLMVRNEWAGQPNKIMQPTCVHVYWSQNLYSHINSHLNSSHKLAPLINCLAGRSSR